MERKSEMHIMFVWLKRRVFFFFLLQAAVLSHVTGEGRAQLEVRLSRDQPVPLVSVLSVLSQSLQENMPDLSHHVTESCRSWWRVLFRDALSARVSSSWMTSQETTYKNNMNISVQPWCDGQNEHCCLLPHIIISVVWLNLMVGERKLLNQNHFKAVLSKK